MKRNEMLTHLNDEYGFGLRDLNGIVAVGYNELGGGLFSPAMQEWTEGRKCDSGIFLFETEEEAQQFIDDAPISRCIIDWLED